MRAYFAERVGQALLRARKAAKLRQSDVCACAAEMGYPLNVNTLSRIERGLRVLIFEEVLILLEIYGKNINDFIEGI